MIANSALAGLLRLQPGDPQAVESQLRSGVLKPDAIAVGAGLAARLKERGYAVAPFNAAMRALDDEARLKFQNARAEAFDTLRTLLLTGEVALPYSEELEEELRTCSAFTNSAGKLQILSKREWSELLHPRRSPDRLDAVVTSRSGR